MNKGLRVLRSLFVWAGPIAVLLLAVASGFVYWCLATEPGTRWTLETATQQVGGHATGVEGSLWSGVRVGDLAMTFPGASVRAQDLRLEAAWKELTGQRLHVKSLSAQTLDIDLVSTEPSTPSEPFHMPVIPLRVAVDSLAIGKLNIRQNGQPIAVDVDNVLTSLTLSEDGAELGVKSLGLGHELLRLSTQGTITLEALQDPWPLKAELTTHVVGRGADSPLCVRRYVPTLPSAQRVRAVGDVKSDPTVGGMSDAKSSNAVNGKANADKADAIRADARQAGTADAGARNDAAPAITSPESDCALDIHTSIEGSLDSALVIMKGQGQGISLDA